METGKKPSLWVQEKKKLVADCRVFDVESRTSRREEDGREADWFVIHTDDFVNVVALTDRNELVLVRQFRHGSEEFSWELPGGMVDSGESPLTAGIRELKEETGFVGEEPTVFAHCRPNPAIMDNRCHFVLVRSVKQLGATNWDENEEMEVKLVPMEDVWGMVSGGELSHSLTLSALMHYSIL